MKAGVCIHAVPHRLQTDLTGPYIRLVYFPLNKNVRFTLKNKIKKYFLNYFKFFISIRHNKYIYFNSINVIRKE